MKFPRLSCPKSWGVVPSGHCAIPLRVIIFAARAEPPKEAAPEIKEVQAGKTREEVRVIAGTLALHLAKNQGVRMIQDQGTPLKVVRVRSAEA